MDIDKSFQGNWKKIEELIKLANPEIDPKLNAMIKFHCKIMCNDIIHEIGNNTNSLTYVIQVDL